MSNHQKETSPWYQTTYRWGQTNLTEIDPIKCDLEFWKKQWEKTKIQGVIINCGGIVAYYPSRFNIQRRAEYLGDRDYFKEFSDAAKASGLKVIARMDIRNVAKSFYTTHPDWFSLDKEGNPIVTQDMYFSCVNSDYYKTFIPNVLSEIIEKYHPDGFADNSWKGLTRNTICYCDNCKDKFQRERGLFLPEAVDWNDPIYCEWVRWGYECRLENWDLFNEVTKKAGGEDCLWIGMMHADAANPGGGFGDIYEMCKRSKIIFSDHQSRNQLNGFEENATSGSQLRLAASEDILVPESMSNYVTGSRIFRLSSSPPAETRMWMINGIAGGISPWYHHISGGQEDRRQFDIPVPIFRWHADCEKYLYNRKELSSVGLIWSQSNGDFYGRNNAAERVTMPWNGFSKAMMKSRIPFIPIHASDIARYESRLNTLILPDIAVLSEPQMDAICDFVHRGGNLVMTGSSATYDKNGNYKGDSRLWEMLGLSSTGEKAGIAGNVSNGLGHYEAHSYLRLPKNRHEIFSEFDRTDILPFGGSFDIVASTGALKPISSYIPPFPIFPPEFSWIRKEQPEVGTIFAGTLSNGARVVYFAADIDRCYGRSALPDHRILLANAVNWASGNSHPIKVQGPGYINCKAYLQENRFVIRSINLSGGNDSGYFEENFPIGPVKILVKKQGFDVKKARLAVSDTAVPFTIEDDCIAITISKIEDHELLIIE